MPEDPKNWREKINFEYVKIAQEVPLFCLLIVRSGLKNLRVQKKAPASVGTLLLVNVSLVGEFAATAPAMCDFIKRNPTKTIDLLVSPPLAPLAQKMRGVRHVFVARSIFGRASESAHGTSAQAFDTYEETVVTRISPEVYRLLRTVDTGKMRTALPYLLGYGFHLSASLLRRKVPRTWRQVNFTMLGGAQKEIPLEEIFDFSQEEMRTAAAHAALQTSDKKVLIHTRASWAMNQWPLERWAELLNNLSQKPEYRFIFIGSKHEQADYEQMLPHLTFAPHSLIGQTSLSELLLVMRTSDYFIGIDSGPSNLAHLAQLPSITLFGPGPHMYTPWSRTDIALDRSRGRGLYQRYFFTNRNRIIDRIAVKDAEEAFERLTQV